MTKTLLPPITADLVQTLSAEEIPHIAKMTNLTHLDLGHTNGLRDASISHLSYLVQLQTLSLTHASITVQTITALAPLTKLKRLHVSNCKSLGDEAIAAIVSQFRELEELVLDGNQLTDAAIDMLQKLPKLHTLILGQQDAITLQGMKKLGAFNLLSRLSLTQKQAFSESLISDLLISMPCLRTLKLFVLKQHQALSAQVMQLAGIRKRNLFLTSIEDFRRAVASTAKSKPSVPKAKS